jgi:hypothetical protein
MRLTLLFLIMCGACGACVAEPEPDPTPVVVTPQSPEGPKCPGFTVSSWIARGDDRGPAWSALRAYSPTPFGTATLLQDGAPLSASDIPALPWEDTSTIPSVWRDQPYEDVLIHLPALDVSYSVTVSYSDGSECSTFIPLAR